MIALFQQSAITSKRNVTKIKNIVIKLLAEFEELAINLFAIALS